MLTLSERWFTTQTSVLVRAATATGSRPTGTRLRNTGVPRCQVEYFQRAIGRVDGKERGAIGRNGQRAHMTAFEFHERGPRGGSGCVGEAELTRGPGGESDGESG